MTAVLCSHCLTLAPAHPLYAQLCVRCGEVEDRLQARLIEREQAASWAQVAGRVVHGEPPELERVWRIG